MKKLFFFSIAASVFGACKISIKTVSDNPINKIINCPEKTLTFNNGIQSIFEKKCTHCHNKNERAGYNFHKLESVKKAAQSGKLLGAIKHRKGYSAMPRYVPFLKKASKLDQKSIEEIECWINNGMKE